jgi:hypothetical protein
LVDIDINPENYVVKHKISNGVFSIKDVISASDKEALASLSQLAKTALDKNPEGYRIIRLDIGTDNQDKQDAPKEASILLDLLKQGSDYGKLQQGAHDLQIIGTLVGIGRDQVSGQEEGLTWFLAKVKGVHSGI